MRIFRGRGPHDHLATGFHWYEGRVFAETSRGPYEAGKIKGAYGLRITRASYFAWEIASLNRSFGDFVLDGRVEIDPANGHSAAGFLIRYNNEENFYTFLVDNRGRFRFDCLFNNHPLTLIDWTPIVDGEPGAIGRNLRVIAHGTSFSFYADEEWIAEIEDESIPEGGIGFAGQNYADADTAGFRLMSFAVEARPAAVEREYLRWVHYVPHSPAARLALAETLFAAGGFSAAAVQLKRSLKGREGTAREHFLLAESYLRLSLHQNALQEIEEVLRREPSHAEALFEKANLLYLSNEFLAARDYLRASMTAGTMPKSAAAWNLLGNTEYALGNWQKAADAYTQAVGAQGDEPMFLKNAARSLEMAGRRDAAVSMYLKAARLFFRAAVYDELSLILPRVLELDPSNAEVRALEAKMAYHEGRRDYARTALEALVREGSTDSAVYYLLGLILSEAGDREEALARFARAAELEPSFPLYHFRLAEALHLLGRDPWEALRRAKSLDAEDPWISNLEGLVLLEEGRTDEAEKALNEARTRAPHELDICLNLSEAMARAGKTAEALDLLDGQARAAGEDARIHNQEGNILSRARDFGGAISAYEAAIKMDPDNFLYKENCAAACLEADMVHRAEELLSQVEKVRPSPSVYNLLGNAAVLKGEYQRAELAYAAGLNLQPGNPDLETNLAQLQLERSRWPEARALLKETLSRNPGYTRAQVLLERARARFETRLSCAACGREWWVPKDIGPQPALTVRGEPPADAPAGKCPKCGRLYCVGCASAHVSELRFHCAECGAALKLNDNSLRWLLSQYLDGAAEEKKVP